MAEHRMDGVEATPAWVTPALTVAVSVVGALWVWSAARWVARGQPGYGIPAMVMVVACAAWLLLFARRREMSASSWDPELTIVRPGPRVELRSAAVAALMPLLLLLNALTPRETDPTVGGVVYATVFGLAIVGAIVLARRMLEAELRITADEVAFSIRRPLGGGSSVRRRRRDLVEGYRRRLGSIELLPWPPAGGGVAGRRQRLAIPSMVLGAADVERALSLHGIRPA